MQRDIILSNAPFRTTATRRKRTFVWRTTHFVDLCPVVVVSAETARRRISAILPRPQREHVEIEPNANVPRHNESTSKHMYYLLRSILQSAQEPSPLSSVHLIPQSSCSQERDEKPRHQSTLIIPELLDATVREAQREANDCARSATRSQRLCSGVIPPPTDCSATN